MFGYFITFLNAYGELNHDLKLTFAPVELDLNSWPSECETTTTIFHRFRAHTRREVNWLDDWQRPTSTSCEDYRARCFSRFWWRLKINQNFLLVRSVVVSTKCAWNASTSLLCFLLCFTTQLSCFLLHGMPIESVDLSLFDIDRSALAEVETESKKLVSHFFIVHASCVVPVNEKNAVAASPRSAVCLTPPCLKPIWFIFFCMRTRAEKI